MNARVFKLLSLSLVAGLAPATPATARNVDLSTVPSRASVQLTIYNSEDLTLVRETRAITFKKGVNPLQFSWANTRIDPTSVELRFLSRAHQLEVADTTFPHDKPQMLYWNVQSEFDGEAKVEIRYFTSGISWAADYLAIANAGETEFSLDAFVRVTNQSGEDYENAQVRLVVGTINLVEKMSELAHLPIDELRAMKRDEAHAYRNRAADAMVERAAAKAAFGAAGDTPMPESASKPKEIIKEGLSEYFLYTIEGTETIPNGWSKRMRSFGAEAVPLKIEYRYRPAEYGERLVRMYLAKNDKDSKLGDTPLPNGTVRVLRHNGRDGLAYLVEQPIKYVPIGDKIELTLGEDPEVIFELVKQSAARDNIWLQVRGLNVFRRVGDGVRIEQDSVVAGWDDHERYAQRIRNYTAKPIDVEIRRSYDGHVVFRSGLAPKLHDYRTVEFKATVPAGKKVDLPLEIVRRQGHNAKQNNVTLEKGDVR